MDLTNASAIVTGGAGGFGAATVRRLVQKGAKVVIADVSDERGEALAREVGSGSLYLVHLCKPRRCDPATRAPSPQTIPLRPYGRNFPDGTLAR